MEYTESLFPSKIFKKLWTKFVASFLVISQIFPGNRLLWLNIFSNFVPLLVREHDSDLFRFLVVKAKLFVENIEFKKLRCLWFKDLKQNFNISYM